MTSSHKIAQNAGEAFLIQETFSGKPHGWVQWKGTDVCMDVRCVCGNFGHIDATFAYNIQCGKCKRFFAVNGHVELIELQEDPKNCIIVDAEGGQ